MSSPDNESEPATGTMEKRTLGSSGMDVSVLSFGASSLGAEFRKIDLAEAIDSVHVALDHGMNLIDTSPYYGHGRSELRPGAALREMRAAPDPAHTPRFLI